ncbi:MAG: isoleucine--tRNA ligase [Deltaproteobacteria bacterium]|nr:isoleucine--tRNA ligase [Deltaproteobacteria bacterium]
MSEPTNPSSPPASSPSETSPHGSASGEAVLTPKERKTKYKKSLNLPKTSFPMRANLAQNEPQSQKRWSQEKLYDQILDSRQGDRAFVFHDGPPYANGAIHVGHLLNKVLKDIIVRSRNLGGQRCEFIPGWDCHGLPIEHKVLQDLVAAGKIDKINSLNEDQRRMAVRRECARYATKQKTLQSEQLQRLLTLGDYDHPYMTMNPAYEAEVLGVFADLVNQGLVYRALKPVHWSIANETALAEAELEYRDREDPSIFVLFEAVDAAALLRAFGQPSSPEVEPVSFMIWTTTPWTLPANRLIAVHKDFEYALVRLDGRLAVVASKLLEKVTETAGTTQVEVLARVPGDALLSLEYHHPFCPGGGRIVEADYVTLEDGTGLVHTAPGHGQDDYLTGQREGIEVYSPVRGDGTFDETAPEWLQGLAVWDGNDKVIDHLRESGHLFHHQQFVHSYPHDWRSKTPVIFRGTEQWFIGVDLELDSLASQDSEGSQSSARGSLRSRSLEACEKEIRFIPAWGAKRLRGMLESRPDWCISRQRAWGLPIPAFRRPDGSTFLTAASTRAVAEAFRTQGSDAWFTQEPATLLASYDPASDPEAPSDLDRSTLTKMYDIFDVWFESGSSWNAVLRSRSLGYPADLYLEGSDQHRGWFQLSLLPALGVTGQPPYRDLLTHGFMVDKEGRKMSKSSGNALSVEDLLKRFGADVCRWWVSSLAFENDIKVDLGYFELAGESYRKVRNTLRFLLSNLHGFDRSQAVDLSSLPPESLDAYALAKTRQLSREVQAAYQAYQFRQAHLLLFDFCNDTLSALYLNAVKDRLYCDQPDSLRRLRSQTVLWKITEVLAALLAPILPHTADEASRALEGEDSSVHLQHFSEPVGEASPSWPRLLEVREAALKALEGAKGSGIENPLDAGLRLPDPEGLLAPFGEDLADIFGVSRVELQPQGETIEVIDLRQEPRCERSWRRDATVRQYSDGGWLSLRDAQAVGMA